MWHPHDRIVNTPPENPDGRLTVAQPNRCGTRRHDCDAGPMTDALAGYETGPDGTQRAAAAAWSRIDRARAVVLVEGVSDQIAVDATAEGRGVDLERLAVVVLPIGGAQAIARTLTELHRCRDDLVVAGLCDVGEEPFFRRAITSAGLGGVDGEVGRLGLERAGFFVCVDDLEDELIRAAGPDLVERVMIDQGDRSSFATLRVQAAWRDAPFEAQARRFFGAGARRKHRYARALIDALGPARVPRPLVGVLERVTAGTD
jgi:hypothetical protein